MTFGLDDVIEHVPLPAYVFRVSGSDFVLTAASAEARQRNPGLEALLGHPMQGLYRDAPQAIADAERCAREGVKIVREMTVRRYDRTEATQEVRLTYLPLPPDRLLLFMEDIASPDTAQAALRESEARYRSLVLSLPDPVLLRGPDGRLLACDDVSVRYLGKQSQAEVIGLQGVMFSPDLVAYDEKGELVGEHNLPSLNVLVTGKPEYGRVYSLHRGDKVRWLRVSAQPIFSATGAVTGSVAICTDITEQRALEAELRRVHRLESLGRLAGGVAHDFNNLLAAILGSVELLSGQVVPAGVEDLATIRMAAERARDLTRQLLAFARRQPAQLRTVELGTVIGTLERLLQRVVRPSVELAFSMGGSVWVRADPALLEQVLVNLVVNASDAMPGGGRAEIRVYRMPEGPLGDTAVLEVSDSGVGMDERTLSMIFDPFFTTKQYGTGLGLASSYGIIRQHGGDIVAESRPGAGTRFRVLLPAAPPPQGDADGSGKADLGTIPLPNVPRT